MIVAIRNTLRPGGTPTMNKFIRQNFASATSFKRLYLGCFRGDLDTILQRHYEMMEVHEGCVIW